jgi:N-acetylglucosaminyl-diphospho-decaprenol L-rhamnosyltransferase
MASSELSYEVLVCDSATEDDTRLLMNQEYSEVRFFPFVENVGFKKLFNTSLQEARGEYVFAINSDVLLTEKVLDVMVLYLAAHPEIGILGPKQLHFNGTFQQTAFRFYKPQTILYRRTRLGKMSFGKKHIDWFTMAGVDITEPTPVDWVIGSAMLVKKEVALEQVGLMDERFFMYMEDVDWCRRFWAAGLQVVYYPTVHIYHYHAKGSAKGGFFKALLSNKLTWYHIASAGKYFWKYRGQKNPRIK